MKDGGWKSDGVFLWRLTGKNDRLDEPLRLLPDHTITGSDHEGYYLKLSDIKEDPEWKKYKETQPKNLTYGIVANRSGKTIIEYVKEDDLYVRYRDYKSLLSCDNGSWYLADPDAGADDGVDKEGQQ